MKRNYFIYFNNKELKNGHSPQFAKSIFELGLKKGDTIKSFPFNFFGDEGGNYIGEIMEYQNKTLVINEIDFEFVDTWNSTIKTNIHIRLSELD